ncbi:YcnI family protein [Herbiconiux moechotypicola]|nr:YcnI family protein [Herbiconiux moechotypicola]
MKNSFARAAGAASALVAGAALALAAPLSASAHVHVDPAQAEAGGYTVITFRVPTESATASTTSVTVDLPTDTPFTSVSYQPVPGWSAVVTTAELPSPVTVGDATLTEAPVSVTWTADDGVGILPGQYQQFPLSVGPVPDTGSVLLPTHQQYSDGTVVDWDEETPASGEEPENPAPVLYIGDEAPTEGHDHESASGVGATTGTDGAEGAEGAEGADGQVASIALGLGIGGFVLGAGALVLAAAALLRRPGAGAGARGNGTAR